MRVAVDNELRLKYFDQLVAAIGTIPDTTNPGEAAALIVAIMDLGASAALGCNGVDVVAAKDLIDEWVQNALDGLGQIHNLMKPLSPPRPRLTLVP